jgi:two-component system, LytTR family, response regulator
MNCLIVDDNPLASLTLKQLASQVKSISIIGECSSAVEAYDFLNKNQVDLLFSDIEMPGMSGLELVKSLSVKPIIIFTSSQDKYAAEAFELCVADYLIKPVNLQRLLQAVSRAEEIMQRKNTEISNVATDYIFIKENKAIKKITCDDILWIEAMGDYVKIRVGAKFHIVHSTLKQLEDKLDASLFIRVHRSYIIAINKLESLEDGILTIGGSSIPIAETYKAQFLKKIKLV